MDITFTPYTPPNTSFPVRFYASLEGVSIGKQKNRLTVIAPDVFTQRRVINFLRERGVELNKLGLRQVGHALMEAGLISRSPRQQRGRHSNHAYTAKPVYDGHGKSINALIIESNQLDLSKAPFRECTLKDVSVLVSSNEPPHLVSLFHKTQLPSVHAAHLPVGDIVITNKNGDTLFIERKTINDLRVSVTQDQHAHDQSERLFDEVCRLKQEGKRAMAVWLVEAMPDGHALVAEALDDIQMVDGLLNYFTMINEQPVFQTYSTHHTVYTAAKLIQGFFEQKLYYAVKTSNPSVNRSKKARLAAKQHSPARQTGSGVTRHTSDNLVDILSYLPGITTATAKTLAQTGKSLMQMTQMSEAELAAVHGIGKKSAARIYRAFNITI